MEKKNTRTIEFFNVSLLLEELSENEMFQLKGGGSEPDPWQWPPGTAVPIPTPKPYPH